MSSLARRIEFNVLEKFDNDKRAALRYLDQRCMYYARKADSYRGSKFHQQWRQISKAYTSAEFAISYSLDMEEQMLRDAANDDFFFSLKPTGGRNNEPL